MREVLFLMAILLLCGVAEAQPKRRPAAGKLDVGKAAPDFELPQLDANNRVKLADLRGKPVVLVFGSCT